MTFNDLNGLLFSDFVWPYHWQNWLRYFSRITTGSNCTSKCALTGSQLSLQICLIPGPSIQIEFNCVSIDNRHHGIQWCLEPFKSIWCVGVSSPRVSSRFGGHSCELFLFSASNFDFLNISVTNGKHFPKATATENQWYRSLTTTSFIPFYWLVLGDSISHNSILQ